MNGERLELGIVVSISTLRGVLKQLSTGYERYWIASDPEDAAESGTLTLGFGHPQCEDRLNTLTFRVPVIGNRDSKQKSQSLLLLIDSNSIEVEQRGVHFRDGEVRRHELEDFLRFFMPLKHALASRLLADMEEIV